MNLENIIKSRFKLNKSQLKVYMAIFLDKQEVDMQQLVLKLNRDRTTIQRTINYLLKRKLIIKRQQNLHKGFKHYYHVKNKEDIKQEILIMLNNNLVNIKKLFLEF